MNGNSIMKNLVLSFLVLALSVGTARAQDAAGDPVKALAQSLDALLTAQKFDQIEAVAKDLAAPNAYFPGGVPKGYAFYSILGDGKLSALSFDDRHKALEAWVAASPHSVPAHIALAQARIAKAIVLAGFSRYQYARPDAPVMITNPLFKLWMHKGRDQLQGLTPKDDPYIYIEYMELTALDAEFRKETGDIYAAAVKDYPGYYALYSEFAKEWCDQNGEGKTYLQSLAQAASNERVQIAYAFAAKAILPKAYMIVPRNPTGIDWAVFKPALKTLEKFYGFSQDDWGRVFTAGDIYGDQEFAAEAFPHLLVAAQAGDKQAQFYVGHAYRAGLGTAKNGKEALKWLMPAAAGGDKQAQFELGMLYYSDEPKDYVQALKWLQASRTEPGAAEYYIGDIYFIGGYGVQQDAKKANQLNRQAAMGGDPRAMLRNSTNMYYGIGTQKDEKTAYQLIKAQAENGDALSKQWLAQHPAPDAAPTVGTSVSPEMMKALIEARDLMEHADGDQGKLIRANQLISAQEESASGNAAIATERARYFFINSINGMRQLKNGKYTYYVQTHDKTLGLDAAESGAKAAMQADPTYAEAYILWSRIHYDEGRLDLARENLKKADELKVLPGDAELNLSWAQVLMASGEYDQAIERCLRVLKNAEDARGLQEAREVLAQLYVQQKQYIKAQEIYQQALQQEPHNAGLNASYSAFLRMFMHDYDGAVKYARAAVAIKNSSEASAVLAMALYEKCADMTLEHQGDAAEAQKYYQEAVALYPHPENLLTNYGSYAEESLFVKWLISKGYNANTADEAGNTALLNAAAKGRADAVKMLLSLQADPEYHTASGWTALMVAAASGQDEVVKVLLQAGVDPRSREGQYAAYAASKQGYPQLAEYIKNYRLPAPVKH